MKIIRPLGVSGKIGILGACDCVCSLNAHADAEAAGDQIGNCYGFCACQGPSGQVDNYEANWSCAEDQ